MSDSGESSTSNLISKQRTQLIAFDKEKKIRYFGPCSNVQINCVDRCLILTTNSTVKSLKEFASTFNRIFIQKENALCVIDGITYKDLMIIFSSKAVCDRIFKRINEVKYPNITPPPKNEPSTDDYLFKTNIYVPILKEIKQQIPGFEEIKTTIWDLVNSFEALKRQSYINMAFENDVVRSSVVSANNEIVAVRKSTVSSNVEVLIDNNGDVDEQSTICTNNNETLNGSLNSTNQSLNDSTKGGYGIRKRSRPNYFEMKSVPRKRKSGMGKVIKSTDFQFVDHMCGNRITRKLIIFDENDRSLCHHYNIYDKLQQRYRCSECKKNHNQYVYAHFIKSEDNGNNGDIVQLGTNEHLCKPKKFP